MLVRSRKQDEFNHPRNYHIEKLDLLTREQEIELAKRKDCNDLTAVHTLVERNLRLVIKVVGRYSSPTSEDYEDLVQEGTIGLQQAAVRFDYHKGHRFSTFAMYWIRHFVVRSIENTGHTIRIPAWRLLEIKRRLKACDKLDLGFTPDNIVKATGLSYGEALKLWKDYLISVHKSLDQPLKIDSGSTRLDLIDGTPTYDNQQSLNNRIVARQQIERALLRLNIKSRQLIRIRYLSGNGQPSFAEVGEVLGISPSYAKAIEYKALKTLRHLLSYYVDDLST